MSYNDPYYSRSGAATYPPQQPYPDQADNYYSYDNNQPHQTYDQGGYGYSEHNFQQYKDEPVPATVASKERDNAYDDTFNSSTRMVEPKTSKAMRRWRYEHQGNLWTAGSRVRCCGRFFCCTISIFLFLFVGIVLSLLLWIKPPNVEIGNIELSQASNAINLENDGASVSLDVPISVTNPNYFSVTFKSIDAQIFYPINNTNIGSGLLTNLKIDSNKQTNFSVPFTLNYTTAIDPNFKILSDIAGHCGFTGGASSQITVDYQIKLDFKVLFIPIKPTIKNSASFSCPFSANDLAGLLKAAGINIPGLTTLLKALL